MPAKRALLKSGLRVLFSEGPVSLLSKGYKWSRDYWYERRHPYNRRSNVSKQLLESNGFNVCYNRDIPNGYDPDSKNILLAVESPAVIEYEGWIEPEMNFYAEISFANFRDLDRYYCPRKLYIGNDNFVELHKEKSYRDKPELVSLIYSESEHLRGHRLRHEIAAKFDDRVNIQGSGSGEFETKYWSDRHQADLQDKEEVLASTKFQIVVENGKYPEYVSEKFFDALKTNTVPIYWGGERAVRKLGFDTDGVLFFDDIGGLADILDELSPEMYEEMRPAVANNRDRLLELRQEEKLDFYLDTVSQNYFHSMESYHEYDYDELAIGLD